MLAYGAYVHSPTIDEPAYLVAGFSHWELHNFELTKVSPPLVRLVATIPVLLASPKFDWSGLIQGPGKRVEKSVGRDFIAANGRRSFLLLSLARLSTIPFSLLGAYFCFRWGQQLWGGRAGLGASVLWCFCPNILAHGQLMTPDVAVTSVSLAAAFYFKEWFYHRTWYKAGLAGVVLGFAILAKTNAIALFPAVMLSSIVSEFSSLNKRRDVLFAISQLAFAFGVSICVLNLGYGFDGIFTRLGQYSFVSHTFRGYSDKSDVGNRFTGSILDSIPVPLPKPFLEGIDLQRRDFENDKIGEQTYFRGNWYHSGWWWFYVYAVIVKVPVETLILVLTAIVLVVIREGRVRAALQPQYVFLWLPGFCFFALASSQTGIGHGLRYVLPAFPYVFIFASGIFCKKTSGKWMTNVGILLLIGHVTESVLIYPHQLAYFNTLAGGPLNGHAHLLDGNLDWGQDLFYLEQWITSHPEARPLHMAYWGNFSLDAVGANYSQFDFELPIRGPVESLALPPAGWYAISVNRLRVEPNMGFDNRKYSLFLHRSPVCAVGYSIYVYYFEYENK